MFFCLLVSAHFTKQHLSLDHASECALMSSSIHSLARAVFTQLFVILLLCVDNLTPRIPNSYCSCFYYCSSQKASSGDISETKRGIIDPLVSKQPGKNSKRRKLKKN